MKYARPKHFQYLILGTVLYGATWTNVAVGDLFQFDLVFDTDIPLTPLPGVPASNTVFTLSEVVQGTSQWDPDEPFPSFSLADAGPMNLQSSVFIADDSPPFEDALVATGTDLTQSYSSSFGWGMMTLSIEDAWGSSYTDLSLQWTLEGPTWNEQSITGTGGTGFISDNINGGLYDLTISSWSLTLIPAPASLLPLVLAFGARRTRRRV